MKRAAKEINHLPHMLLEDHKRKRAAGTHQEAQDFMDVMLRFLRQSKMAFRIRGRYCHQSHLHGMHLDYTRN